jgi:hypothetical protein
MFRLSTVIVPFLALPAFADNHATGDQIRAAIAGNTVQGSMTTSGAYTEFYAADGTIKGADYAGTWTIDGDQMCFAYGEAPTCFGVRLAGDQVTWVGATGDEGTGTILSGNPNGW